jgi:hypothetical protein
MTILKSFPLVRGRGDDSREVEMCKKWGYVIFSDTVYSLFLYKEDYMRNCSERGQKLSVLSIL